MYSNTAPRTEEATPAGSALGGELCHLELANGVPVVAVNAGYNLSFVKPFVAAARSIETPAEGSQFRSRDSFPDRVAEIATGSREPLDDPLPIDAIPDPPDRVVCHVDGYGNIKTSIRAAEFDGWQGEVGVELNGVNHPALAARTAFESDEGTLMLVPGSAGGDDPYLELICRGASAAAWFDDPSPGDDVVIR